MTTFDLAAEGRSPGQMALLRFRKNRRAWACLIALATMAGLTILIPWISAHDYRSANYPSVNIAPDGRFWMGTDGNARDLMVRVFRGGRISFAVGFLATLISLSVGVTYGAVSAFAGGKTDLLLMRIVDILYGLPTMFVVIIIMTFVKGFVVVFLVLGLLSWLTISRIVRGQILSLKEREFVEAARALGTGSTAIIFRHLIPNILGPVIVYATLTVPSVMLQESFLSFLGLGISEPETSWGGLISEGAGALFLWWRVTFPGACMALTLFCLNAVGDGLRDAFDTQQR